jgi:hypothetical protein
MDQKRLALTPTGAARVSTKHKSLGFDPLTKDLVWRSSCAEARRFARSGWTAGVSATFSP